MTAALNLSLILLVVVVIAAVIATTIYLVKFLMELCLLTKNLNDTTDIVKKELNPLLSELTEHTIANEIEPPKEVLRKEFQQD